MDSLPDELILRIFSLITEDAEQLLRLEAVCKHFYRSVSSFLLDIYIYIYIRPFHYKTFFLIKNMFFLIVKSLHL